MEIIGIISLIFGIVGLISSLWYIGIIPCAVGIALGIVGLTDYLADKKFATAGMLISILGAVFSIYMFVSDIDSGKLIVLYNDGKSQNTDVAENEMPDKLNPDNSRWNPNPNTEDNTGEIYQTSTENMAAEESLKSEKEIAATPKTEEAKSKTTDVLYQDENIIISYDKISEKSIYDGYNIDFIVENRSSRTLTVQVRETSINGYMVEPVCSIEIAPGKKAVDGMMIWGDDAKRTPVNSINSIETKFHIFDFNDFNYGYDTENIKIL